MRYFYFNPPVSGKPSALFKINWIPKTSTHSILSLTGVNVKKKFILYSINKIQVKAAAILGYCFHLTYIIGLGCVSSQCELVNFVNGIV